MKQVLAEGVAAAWGVYAGMAPWLLFRFLAAGAIAVLIPGAKVRAALGGEKGWKGVLWAVLLGVPLPVCSCGVIPLATGLRKRGAGKGATAAFLISTPQTGIDSILASWAVSGPVFAWARPVAAALTGLAGGAVVEAVGGRDADEGVSAQEADAAVGGRRGVWGTVAEVFRQGYVRLLGAVVRPMLWGLLGAVLIQVAVPDDFFAGTLGGNDWVLFPLMAAVGMPMYVCSKAAIPIAASLMWKGLSAGAAFVFLMVGPAMNLVSVTTVAGLIGKRATAAYLGVIAAGAFASGAVVNWFASGAVVNWIGPAAPGVGACCAGHGMPEWVRTGSAVALGVLMAWHLRRGGAGCQR